MGSSEFKNIGRYLLFEEIAAGGMATVHIGRMSGPAGFSRVVAIKRLHAQFVKDPEFVAMLLDEARLAARIHHPNVASTLDVVEHDGEIFLVMELLRGESLARLTHAAKARGARVPPGIAVAAVVQALHGLHAAHEAKSERGEPLGIVHRDVSPQNIFVGVDGATRVLDFGIAKAANRLQSTRDGQIKGKLRYMAPEQVQRKPVDRRVDIYAAAMVLYETLTGERLFAADDPGGVVHAILHAEVLPPSALVPSLPIGLDAVVLRGLSRLPAERFATAAEFADTVEDAVRPAKPRQVSAWVKDLAADSLRQSEERVAAVEVSGDASPASAGPVSGSAATSQLPGAASPNSEGITVPVAGGALGQKGEGTATDAQLVTDASARTLPSRRDPKTVRRITLGALLLLLGGLSVFSMLPSRARPRDVMPGPPAAAAPPTGALPAPSAPSAAPTAEASAPPGSTSSSAPTAEAEATPPSEAASADNEAPRSNRRSTGRARPSIPGASPPSKTARPGCEPPYQWIDGIKTWKPQCL